MTCIDCHKGIAHSLPAMYEIDSSTPSTESINGFSEAIK